MLEKSDVIAVLGGTGDLGSGLARRLAVAGFQVVIGSRDPSRAQGIVDELNRRTGAQRISAATYQDAAKQAKAAALTVPFASQTAILEQVKAELSGKVLIDCTVPLMPPKVGTVQLPAQGSAAQIAQAFLGEGVRVVSALQNVGAALLQADEPIECDVLVCSDNAEARQIGVQVVEAAGLRGIEAGPLANSAAADALTSILITINRRYKADHAGIRITGLPNG
ncbi:MAG: NADPH-dependent F420 reductase [Caulobacterales bacterium]